jgi:MscS family membrane protein
MKVICDDVREMIKNHPDIDQKQTIIVHFNRYGDSHLEFMIYAFTKTSEWVPYHAIKENVLLKVMEIVEGHGAEFAFPTRTLHVAVDGHPDEAAMMQKITEEGRQ